MSLRYALLAVLTVEPMTGYDLSKLFQQSVSHVWNAPDSQIYPELKRMEKEGLVSGEDIPWGPRGRKKQYTITQQGISAFTSWMNEPVSYAPERNPAYLKAAYLEWASPEGAIAVFTAHREHFEKQLEDWTTKLQEINEVSNSLLIKRLSKYPQEKHSKIIAYKRFTYEGLIKQAKLEIDWANRGIELAANIK